MTESPEAKNQSLGMVFATDEGSFSIYSENASSIKLLLPLPLKLERLALDLLPSSLLVVCQPLLPPPLCNV